MAHVTGAPVYRALGRKIDSLQTRTPWNENLSSLLQSLFTPEEAELVVQMPYSLAGLGTIARITHRDPVELQKILDRLCEHGLVMDLWVQGKYRYMPTPMVVGIFELVMMRTGEELRSKEWAELFHRYMHGDDSFFKANCSPDKQVSVMRTLVHEKALGPAAATEVLDYEKAGAIVDASDRFAVGLCSCRHEKQLVGEKACDVPLDTCASLGAVADFMIRRGFAREVSRTEMHESLARSKEFKLVLTADNVQRRVGFICQCCKDCCNLMLGVTRHGCPETIVTSRFISEVNREKCTGCARCVAPCPVNAVEVLPAPNPKSPRNKTIRINEELCLGCGVCALVCALDGIALVKREARVIQPETTFERVILACLERGTLENQIFANPQSMTQQVMRGLVGGFLRIPPVKQALMSDQLRSRFLAAMTAGTKMQRRGWLEQA